MMKEFELLLLLFSFSLKLSLGEHSNCSYSYTLRPNGFFSSGSSNDQCKDSCMTSSPPLEASTVEEADCSMLHHLLQGYNSVIGSGDCLELQFDPGKYWFSSLTRVQVTYSLVLKAPKGGVSIVCRQSSNVTCSSENGGPGVYVAGDFMMAVNGSEEKDVFAELTSLSFSHCSDRIQFNNLRKLTVANSSFTEFSSLALDLFNVDDTLIEDSLFKNCINRNPNVQYRANGGAVAIAYYYTNTSRNVTLPQLDIVGCKFEDNYAYTASLDHVNLALVNSIVTGRGGGMGISPQGNLSNVFMRFKSTTFTRNWAQQYGGGIWFLVSGENTYHDFVVDDCVFLGNFGGYEGYGGGIQMAMLLRNVHSPRPIRVVFNNSYFEDNLAGYGGGFSIVEVYSQGSGNELAMYNTRFVGNRALSAGAALMLQTFSYVQNRLERYYYNFTDCVFYGNEAFGGTFGSGFNSVNFFGNITFSNNVGSALRLVGALLEVHGNLTLEGNKVPSNVEGGAMFIQAFGQVKLKSGAFVKLINNSGGRTGAAIVVDVQRSSPVFSELIFNPQCFLIYEDATAGPGIWDDVSIFFSGNKAAVGPAVFVSHLSHCSWFKSERIGDNATNTINTIFSATLFPNWTALHFENTNMALSHQTDPYDSRFYVQTDTFVISSTVRQKEADRTVRPGQTIAVNLTGLDQFNNPTYLIARVSDGRTFIDVGAFNQAGKMNENEVSEDTMIVFDPSLLPVDPAVGLANLTYGYSGSDDLTELAEEPTIPIYVDTPFNVREAHGLRFNMTLSHCQPGYDLAEVNGIKTCTCSVSSTDILACTDRLIILKDGTWAGVELEEGRTHLDIAICPTSYCRCKALSPEVCANTYFQDDRNVNRQCHPTRQGTLCGECVNGTAVGVLRTNCRTCSRNNYYTLALLILGDVLVLGAIFFVLMKLDFHFPHSLKGLLFYIQTAYYVTESFPASFWDIRKYMLYTSSALSLYFPYDFCLSSDTDALTTFGLKFIPPAIAFLMSLCVAVGVYADRSHKGHAGRRQVWRAMWFLLLLFYTPLLHTCTALLKCPNLPSNMGEEEDRRWFFNGEVTCFRHSTHIVLSTVAIVVLTALVLLIPLSFFFIIVTSGREKFKYRTVKWISLALGEGYRDALEARCYAAWELTRRLLLVSIVVALPGRSVASAYVVIASFAVHVFLNPYQKLFQNILEMLVLLNYTVFLLLRSNGNVLEAVNSGLYSGNLVPDSLGDSLPPVDNVAWLFIPPFYFPLVFAVAFSFGALIYRITKSARQWRWKRDEKQNASIEISGYYINMGQAKTQPVSTTTVDLEHSTNYS